MIRRIELILKTQNLTPTQFADKLGIQRSGLSHILAGRNNPSLDFVTKVLNVFPQIQADWLLFGKGSMYALNSSLPVNTVSSLDENPNHAREIDYPKEEERRFGMIDSISSAHREESTENKSNHVQRAEKDEFMKFSNGQIDENATPFDSENRENPIQSRTNTKEIEKIIIFYKNGSFKVYELGM